MGHFNQDDTPDFTSFDGLFERNHQFLCMVALKIVRDDFVAKDLVQDFFVKYWEVSETVSPRNFEAYAYRCVKNSCLNYLKHLTVKGKHFTTRPFSEIESIAIDDSVSEIPETDRRLKRVLSLLDQLPAERRKVFELHAIERLSYKQIAENMGISINTVKTQLKRAYLTLRTKAIIVLVFGFFMKYFV